MYNTNCFLMTDFYKATHLMQYDKRITKLTSYLTPRKSRLSSENIDEVVVFGISLFCKKYLADIFHNDFFMKDFQTIRDEIYLALGTGLGYNEEMCEQTIEKVKELWELRYLPIEINGLPEGSLCPMGVPAIEITTTNSNFAWVGQAIESILSCSVWHPMVSATIAREYAVIAKMAFDKTSDCNYRKGMCDFSMRGQESYESAVASAMGWLTAFDNSSTIDAGFWIKDTYNCDFSVHGLTSTEHSVMCSDAALNGGNERETYRRLLTEVYPNTSFAAVCDSYDFWNVVTKILPSLRNEIENHNGFVGVRHDSDEPVHALCGIPVLNIYCNEEINFSEVETYEDYVANYFNEHFYGSNIEEDYFIKMYYNNEIIHQGVYNIESVYETEKGIDSGCEYQFLDFYNAHYLRKNPTWEDMGMVESLFKLFGGEKNSKGYISLNPHIKAVYGDSITLPRATKIYKRLEEKGFAADCVSLGVGSFSMQCIEARDGHLAPFTRDTFSIAIKATYGKYLNENHEEEFFIFKSPKNFRDKKSQKGLCSVYYESDKIKYKDEFTESKREEFRLEHKDAYINYFNGENVYKPVAEVEKFEDVRNRMSNSL